MPRRTADPKEQMIPLRVNKEELLMARLKAAVYCRGNTSAFLRQAVQAYDGPLPELTCFHCRAALDYSFDGTVEWGALVIDHVPEMRCPKCGNRSYDLAVMEVLEAAVEGQSGTLNFRTLMQG